MQYLNRKNRILIGITLFSMFFGAGNLIFPPFLGAQAGEKTFIAFAGFALSAIFLPILGVVAVTRLGGLDRLASRVHPLFSSAYIMILYLAIGPCLAIPRTAGTSFSMVAAPLNIAGKYMTQAQLLYSAVFFFIASLVALHPEKLTDYLGKRLTPVLLVLIVLIFVMTLIHPAGKAAPAMQLYGQKTIIRGFLDGYQTMDTLAALNFGMIIAMNIRQKGLEDEASVVKETIHAGWIAGGVLLGVYGMLSYVGMISSERFARVANGTETLTKMVSYLFGKAGSVLLAVIFVIACFNTCVGLLSCCGKYFHQIFPKVSYRAWVFLFALISMMIANIGLNAILQFSIPVLNAIYPAAILLIFLSCADTWVKKYKAVYPWSMAMCIFTSILAVMDEQRITILGLAGIVRKIPGHSIGFAWIVPTAAGVIIGIVMSGKNKKSDFF